MDVRVDVEEHVLMDVEEHVLMGVVEIVKVDVGLAVLDPAVMLVRLVVKVGVNPNVLHNVPLHAQGLVLDNAMDLRLSLVKMI